MSLKGCARSIMERARRVSAEGHTTAHPVADQISQRLLFSEYNRRVIVGEPLPSLHDAGFRVYSQIDEDGILLYLFRLSGWGTRLR